MSALAEKATEALLEFERDVQRLYDDVKVAKASCVDEAARDVLTRLQSEMIGLKADAQNIKAIISAARQTRYFDPVAQPFPDRKTAAAGDLSLAQENDS